MPPWLVCANCIGWRWGASGCCRRAKRKTECCPNIHENTLNVALSKVKALLSDLEPFCIHDFRRTARTRLAALGVDPHIAERCLNHKIKGIEGI